MAAFVATEVSDAAADADRPGVSQQAVHWPFLDGVRALAALWVVGWHTVTCYVSGGGGWRGLPYRFLSYAHLAVDVFIVLSGFCLALPVARTGVLRGGTRAFFLRRARRILPPYFAALTLAVLWLAALGHFRVDHAALTVGAVVLNGLMLEDVVRGADTVSQQFWSVAAEWKIYFLFPLLLWAGRRFGRGGTLALGAALGIALTGFVRLWPHVLTDDGCPWYVLLFALGICAAPPPCPSARGGRLWTVGLAVSAVALGVLLWRFPILPGTDMVQAERLFRPAWPEIDAAAGAATACALAVLGRAGAGRTARVRAFLEARPLVALGSFSFSLYLAHELWLGVFRSLATHAERLGLPEPSGWSAVGLAVVVIIGGSYVFYRLFERPTLNTRFPQSGVSGIVSTHAQM